MSDLFMTRFYCVYILLQVEYDLHVYIFKWNMVYYVRILVLNCFCFIMSYNVYECFIMFTNEIK